MQRTESVTGGHTIEDQCHVTILQFPRRTPMPDPVCGTAPDARCIRSGPGPRECQYNWLVEHEVWAFDQSIIVDLSLQI